MTDGICSIWEMQTQGYIFTIHKYSLLSICKVFLLALVTVLKKHFIKYSIGNSQFYYNNYV